MRKLLLITCYFPPKVGGGEEYLYNIYKRLNPKKVIVLTPGQAGNFDQEQNFKIYRTNFFSGKFKPTWWPMVKLVKKILKKEKIEIIHFGHYAHYILLARLLKIPYLVFIQGTDFTSYTKSWFGKLLLKFNLKKAKKIITNSQYLKNKIRELGLKAAKINILHPSLDLNEYDFQPQRLIQFDSPNYQTRENPKILLSVGRLTHIKGFDIAIRALSKILEQIPNLVYVIVGDGEEKENLQKLVNELNLNNKVIFTGEIRHKKELSKYYASAQIYIGPSRSEGFGLAFLEARAFGLPIVATNVGGIPEAVENKGLLVKPENIEELANQIVITLKENKKYEPDRNSNWNKKIDKIKQILSS